MAATKESPVSCTIDGVTFTAAEAAFVMEAGVSQDGLPHHGKPPTSTHLRINLGNGTCEFQTIQKLFQLSRKPSMDNIKQVKLEFWVSLSNKNTTCSFSYKGWISSFRTSFLGPGNTTFNHVLDIVITTDISQTSFAEFDIGN